METYDIMFVDDDQSIISLYEAFMVLLPYSFKTVFSGKEALELAERIEFKVFIIDINLGSNVMTGVDLGVALRKRYKDAKIYAMTGHTNLFDNIDPAVAGFDAILNKFSEYSDLIGFLRKTLED